MQVGLQDSDGKLYAQFDLPWSKSAALGDIQTIYFMSEECTCPLGVLANLLHTVPANPHDPLFPWRDSANNGIIYPMVRDSVLQYINFITEVKDGEARLAIL